MSGQPTSRAVGPRHQDPELNYRHTMISLQQQLSPASRRLSRLIHRPTIETLSDLLDKTLLRPSLLLGGLIAAIVVEGYFYGIAHYDGFALSGSEVIMALTIGAILGLLMEWVGRLLPRG